MRFEFVEDANIKSDITKNIITLLPNWFGNENANNDFFEGVKTKPFIACFNEDQPIGFISIEFNNPYTADIYLLGVIESYHRKGIGRILISKAEEYLRKLNYKFLMVKTLGESSDYIYYRYTREFYKSAGFYPIAEFTEIWDAENPCLIMLKNI